MTLASRLLRAYYWSTAQHHSKKGNAKEALKYLEKMNSLSELGYIENSFKAGLMLRLMEYHDAEKLFQDVIDKIETDNSPDAIYANSFCKYWLSQMRGDELGKERAIANAADVDCRAALRRWLPI